MSGMNMVSGKTVSAASVGRWLFLCILSIGVPILLVLGIFEESLVESFDEFFREKQREIDQFFALFEEDERVTGKTKGYFGRLQVFLDGQKRVEPLLDELRALKTQFPGVFRVALFNPQGKYLPEHSDELAPPSVLEETFRRMNAGEPGNSPGFIESMGLQDYFGPLLTASPLKPLTANLKRSSFGSHGAFAFFSKMRYGQPGVIVSLTVTDDFPQLGPWLQTRLFPPCFPDGWQTVLDLHAPPEEWGKELGRCRPFLMKALTALGDSNGEMKVREGFLWSQFVLSPRFRMVVAIPDQRTPERDRKLFWLRASGFVAWMVVAALLFPYWAFIVPPPLSLRKKLFLLLLYGAALPLCLGFIASQGSWRESRGLLEEEAQEKNNNLLDLFDRSFLDFQGNLEREVCDLVAETLPEVPSATVVDELTASDSPVIRSLNDLGRKLASRYSPDILEIFDEQGKSVYFIPWPQRKLREIFSRAVGEKFAEKFGRESGAFHGPEKGNLAQASVEFLGLNIDQVVSLFVGNLGKLVEFKLEQPFFGLLVPVKDQDGRVRFSVFLGWVNISFKDLFLGRQKPLFQKQFPESRILSWKKGYASRIPVANSRGFSGLVKTMSGPVHQTIQRSGIPLLVSGKCGYSLFETSLFLLSRKTGFQERLWRVLWRRMGESLLIILFCLGCGMFLSTHVLLPIADLRQGIQAMRERCFQFRVRDSRPDELGKLAESFNHMMEGMAELEVARIIQDLFFPHAPLQGNGWELSGVSVAARQIGGDYIDFFPLDDSRWFFLIGDVSGHGTSAALVVAMAKALVAHPENRNDPQQLLQSMDIVLSSTLEGKKTMTCAIGIFDPRSGELVMANAGHGYPILLHEGRANVMEVQGTRLGTRLETCHNGLLEKKQWVLKDLDVLILLTDGFEKALDHMGNPIGRDRFREEFPALRQKTAGETVQAVQNWHNAQRQAGPQDDDISLLVLQRAVIKPFEPPGSSVPPS
jgi:hypothetical protein